MKIRKLFVALLVASSCITAILAQDKNKKDERVLGEVTVTAQKTNIDPVYVELKKLSEDTNAFTGEYAKVTNLVVKKDEGVFTLRSGEIYFLREANGRRTGAVFFGEGEFNIVPPVESEKRMLKFFTDSTELTENLTQMVMFFTDKTFDEVKKSPNVQMSTNGPQAEKARSAFRGKEALIRNGFRYNMAARVLLDAYAPPRPGFFWGFINGKKYEKLLFKVDPLGITEVSPEQVLLENYSASDRAIWVAFHLENEYKKGTALSSADRRVFDLISHDINIALRGTRVLATDDVTMKTLVDGQRVLPIDLYPTLRVKRITNDNGEPIGIIQEDEDKDGSLSIILPSAPERGKPFNLIFEYEGNHVLESRGSGNFILNPSARATWYPNNGSVRYGIDQATFSITFRYPKHLLMIGIGEEVEPEKIEGDEKIAKWSTKDVEMKVAGFNYGDFKKYEFDDKTTGYRLEVLVNRDVPNEIKGIQNDIDRYESRRAESPDRAYRDPVARTTGTNLRSISTSSMADYVLGEAQNSTRIYDAYFGRLPFNRIALTQQPNTFFGQAWASLIYMPYLAFVGESQRKQLLGSFVGSNSFWRQVTAHEVAHQWWGHSVGWSSYHDQWMSEGFAELSTSLYIQFVKKDLDQFNEFWEQQRSQIVEPSRSTNGIRPYKVGPVTQGYRLNTVKTGNVAQNLIYPKGAYILHMLRMMMIDPKERDAKFQLMMRDFIKTHYNQAITTEDFKATVEKHITPKMDIDKNGKMDWFFDQWVYGTEVPAYKLEYGLNELDGKTVLSGKITQSGVSDNFAMAVPLYLDFGAGWVSIGSVTIVGNKSFDLGNIALPKKPKRVAICALSDVLATSIENKQK